MLSTILMNVTARASLAYGTGYGGSYGYGYTGGGRYSSFAGMDWSYLLIIAGIVLSLVVQLVMTNTFNKYSKVASSRGMTGAQVAQQILASEGITDVGIQQVQGSLTDHYDPSKKVVNLSQTVYGSSSLAAVGVAAHECGHVIQHARGYAPLRWRTSLVPIANIGSRFSWILIILGLIMAFRPLLTAGIILFSAVLLFQLVTLPVEFDASRRAMQKITSMGMVGNEESRGSAKVLRAAAMTYVAAVAVSALQLFRLIMIARGSSRRN